MWLFFFTEHNSLEITQVVFIINLFLLLMSIHGWFNCTLKDMGAIMSKAAMNIHVQVFVYT